LNVVGERFISSAGINYTVTDEKGPSARRYLYKCIKDSGGFTWFSRKEILNYIIEQTKAELFD